MSDTEAKAKKRKVQDDISAAVAIQARLALFTGKPGPQTLEAINALREMFLTFTAQVVTTMEKYEYDKGRLMAVQDTLLQAKDMAVNAIRLAEETNKIHEKDRAQIAWLTRE